MRRKWLKFSLLLVLLPIGVFLGNVAQSKTVSAEELDELKWQLKKMEEMFARQQEQMQALRDRLEEIENKTTSVTKEEVKQVIKESRFVTKEETEQVVRDYFSTEEARDILGLGMPDITVKYTPDHKKNAILFATTDGRYSLGIGARMQMRYTFKDKDEDFGENDKQNIDIRRARLVAGGNIYSQNLHYYVELQGDKFNVALKDFYVYWAPVPEFNTKVGYFKVPFNRQRMTSSSVLMFQDRSLASEFFDQERDYGIDLYGNPFEGHMEYHVSVFQGAGEDQAEFDNGKDNFDNELMYVLNVRYNPFGKYKYYDESDLEYSEKLKATIGAAVAFNSKLQDEKQQDFNNVAVVADLGLKYRGVSWNNEYYVMSRDPESGGNSLDSNGFYTQLGCFVLPEKLELAGRYSMVDPDTDISNDTQREYTAGVNYYFRGHRSKVNVDFAHFVTEDEKEDEDENQFKVQYQIVF